MVKVYVVSGTPATGKTTFAKKYAEMHDCVYVDGTEFIKENNIYESYDDARDCFVVDIDTFIEELKKVIERSEQDLVIDSHLAHNLPPTLVTKCFITRCELGELKERLLARGYAETKVDENLDAEIFTICLHEAEELGHDVEVIDTSTKKE